jgi:hypothetical protein
VSCRSPRAAASSAQTSTPEVITNGPWTSTPSLYINIMITHHPLAFHPAQAQARLLTHIAGNRVHNRSNAREASLGADRRDSPTSSLFSLEVEAERDEAQKEARAGSPRSLVKSQMGVTHDQQEVQARRPLPEPSPNSGLKMMRW